MYRLDTMEKGLNILYGGWFLGGGGGGLLEGGIAILEEVLNLGGLNIVSIDELSHESIVVTGSLVGSPSEGGASIGPQHFERTLEIFSEFSKLPTSAFVTNEAGAQSITNGWIASAISGLPIIDGACNGRAHPTGIMGSLGLSEDPLYQSIQVAVGGQGDNYLEVAVKDSLENASSKIREASTKCGGFISVLRNPVSASYFKENGAIGTVTMCHEIGEILRKDRGNLDSILVSLKSYIGLGEICRGEISKFTMETKGGFDVGEITIDQDFQINFMNEYLTLEESGKRIATFPDLIMLLDSETGLPLISADCQKGKKVSLILVPRDRLLLGKTMGIKKLFLPLEEASGKEIVKYL